MSRKRDFIIYAFSSYWVLNEITEPDSLVLYPYVLQTSNCYDFSDSLHPIFIPDEVPVFLEQPVSLDFSMVAGDFLKVYADSKGLYTFSSEMNRSSRIP